MYEVLVCDPDEKSFEGSALGLLYTAVSRATTLGDDSGIGSAIYFIGSAFKETRIRNLTCKLNTNHEFELAKKRRYWVQHINSQAAASLPRTDYILQNKTSILQKCNSLQVDYDHVYDRIRKYNKR